MRRAKKLMAHCRRRGALYGRRIVHLVVVDDYDSDAERERERKASHLLPLYGTAIEDGGHQSASDFFRRREGGRRRLIELRERAVSTA